MSNDNDMVDISSMEAVFQDLAKNGHGLEKTVFAAGTYSGVIIETKLRNVQQFKKGSDELNPFYGGTVHKVTARLNLPGDRTGEFVFDVSAKVVKNKNGRLSQTSELAIALARITGEPQLTKALEIAKGMTLQFELTRSEATPKWPARNWARIREPESAAAQSL